MKLFHAITFCLMYVRELVFATARIAWLVVHPKLKLSPQFVKMPLSIEGDFPTLLFVCLISMTPGSLSVSLNRSRKTLLIHLLDTQDPEAEVRKMKLKFETPLLKIFSQTPKPTPTR